MNRICTKCGKPFVTYVGGRINCLSCVPKGKRRKKSKFRPPTNDTVMLCKKWHEKGMDIDGIADLLQRPTSQIEEFLEV